MKVQSKPWVETFSSQSEVETHRAESAEVTVIASLPWQVLGDRFNQGLGAARLFVSDAAQLFSPNKKSTPLVRAETWLCDAHEREQDGASVQAYQKALQELELATFFGEFDPKLLRYHLLKARAYHGLGEYAQAEGEFQLASHLDRGVKYRQQAEYHAGLRSMAESFESQSLEAKTAGDLVAESFALREAIKIYQVLTEEDRVLALQARLTPIAESAEHLELREKIEQAVKEGLFSAHSIEQFEAHLSSDISDEDHGSKLSPFFETSTLKFTAAFDQLSPAMQLRVLRSAAQALRQFPDPNLVLRRVVATASDPLSRLYAQAQVDLTRGDWEQAKLRLVKFREASSTRQDPEQLQQREAAGEFLKEHALAHLRQMSEFNEQLKDQRMSNLTDKEEGGFVDREAIEHRAQQNLLLLQRLQEELEVGAAVTLDEALLALQSEQAQSWDEFCDLHLNDPDFSTLLKRETEKSWKKKSSAEGRRRTLLQEAMRLRHSNGSYAIASQALEAVLEADIAKARAELPEETLAAIRREASNGFTRYRLWQGLQEQREALKENQASEFYARYGMQGPSVEQQLQELKNAQAVLAENKIREEVFKKVELAYQGGEMVDPLSRQAWEFYENLNDPLHRWRTVSDAGRDAMIDEAVVTAATLPLSMGAGAVVRGGLAGSRWAAQWAARGVVSDRLTRAGIFLAGSAIEAVTQELLTMPFAGKAELSRVGYNIVASGAFHGGARLGSVYAQALGVGPAAQHASRLAARQAFARGSRIGGMGHGAVWIGQRSVAASVQISAQTLLGTAAAISETDSPHGVLEQDIFSKLGESWLRMVFTHAAVKGIGVASRDFFTRFESSGWAKLRDGLELFTQVPPTPEAARLAPDDEPLFPVEWGVAARRAVESRDPTPSAGERSGMKILETLMGKKSALELRKYFENSYGEEFKKIQFLFSSDPGEMQSIKDLRADLALRAKGFYPDLHHLYSLAKQALAEKIGIPHHDLDRWWVSIQDKIPAQNAQDWFVFGKRNSKYLLNILLLQIFPDAVPVYRTVHEAYRGRANLQGKSYWGIGEDGLNRVAKGYRQEGDALITTTLGELRSKGIFRVDSGAVLQGAIVLHHDLSSHGYTEVSHRLIAENSEAGTVVESFDTPNFARTSASESVVARQATWVGELMDYLDPHLLGRQKTMEALQTQGHPMQTESKKFAEALQCFREQEEQFRRSEISLDPKNPDSRQSIEVKRMALLEEAARLRTSPYHRMYQAFEKRVARIEKDLQWVEHVISAFAVRSQELANRQGEGFGRIETELQSRTPEELSAESFRLFLEKGDFSFLTAEQLVTLHVRGVNRQEVQDMLSRLKELGARLMRQDKPGRYFFEEISDAILRMFEKNGVLRVPVTVHGKNETHSIELRFEGNVRSERLLKKVPRVFKAKDRNRVEVE